MSKLIVYGIKNQSKTHSADKSLVAGLTVQQLQLVFGHQGQYASQFARVFDSVTKAYYYLSAYNTNADALDLSKWLPVPGAVSAVPQWEAKAYNQGTFVSVISSGNKYNLYIATRNVTASETPQNSSKWKLFDDAASSATANVQVELLTLTNAARTFNIQFRSDITFNHTRIPMLQVMMLNTDDRWEICYPEITIDSTVQPIACTIRFVGDISKVAVTTNNIQLQAI